MPTAVDVLLPLPLAPLRWLAPHGRPVGTVGDRVVVPWQSGVRIGVVTGLHEVSDAAALDLHEALAWLPYVAPLPAETVAWLAREAQRCAVPAGVVLATWNPAWARVDLVHEVRSLDALDPNAGAWRPADALGNGRLAHLRSQGLLDERFEVERPMDTVLVATIDEDGSVDDRLGGGDARRRAYTWLLAHGPASSAAEVATAAGVSASTVGQLVKHGFARYERRRRPPPTAPQPWITSDVASSGSPLDPLPGPSASAVPTAPQVHIVQPGPATASRDEPGIVDGGTPESRLAVLAPLARDRVREGGVILVLVPTRASLEPTAAAVATWGPTFTFDVDADLERREVFDATVTAPGGRVVVGTWPSMMTPVVWSWIVLVDGDHEAYKLRSGPRSWIPDAATGLASAHGCPVTSLGAWPGPETVARHSAHGVLHAVDHAPTHDGPTHDGPTHEGPTHEGSTDEASTSGGAPGGEDVDAGVRGAWWRLPRPRVRWWISDLAKTRSWPLGDEAIRVLRQVADRDRQAIVVAPSKAFSAALGCRDCGTLLMCPHCDVALRWHAGDRRLRCHHCGHDAPPPPSCAACDGHDLVARKSAGAEWVMSAIQRLVPSLPCVRFDGDVRDDVSSLLDGAPGVVVGTQALTSLPTLPATSLIVVTHVDVALGADDFRAAERVIRTLTSLERHAGARAPLGLVQTFSPTNATLLAIARGEVQALDAVRDEMDARRIRFGYPPHGVLARVQLSSRTREAAWAAAEEIRRRWETHAQSVGSNDEILGPADAKIARVRDRRIVHLIVRSSNERRRNALLASGALAGHKGVQIRVDVDPRDIGDVLT